MKKLIGLLILSIILISGCEFLQRKVVEIPGAEKIPVFEYVEPDSEREISEDINLKNAEPYLNEIVYEDIELRSFASSMAGSCRSGNKECQLTSIYRYVVTNFKYYSDPRSREFIQSPYDTIRVEGGDCEDLTILLNSLLENLGIKTYLVLTDTHAYSLACGVDIDELEKEIASSFVRKITIVDETFSLNPFSGVIRGGTGEALPYPTVYTYDVISNQAIDILVVPTKDSFALWSQGKSYQYYPECSKKGVFRVSKSCTMNNQIGIMITNNNFLPARIDLKIDVETIAVDITKMRVSYYKIDGENCVVLDPTAGEYGYPGYDANIKGEKIAIDPVTKETIVLS